MTLARKEEGCRVKKRVGARWRWNTKRDEAAGDGFRQLLTIKGETPKKKSLRGETKKKEEETAIHRVLEGKVSCRYPT